MRRILVVLATLALAASAAGGASAGHLDGCVRVVHASPDAPAVDVLVNGAPAFTDVAFGDITDYACLRFGTYRVQVVPAGLAEPVVIDADLRLRPFKYYTVVAVERLADIEPLVLRDRNRWNPLFRARVRFVHASPDAPPVDVAVAGGPVLFSDVAFKESGGYVHVRPGIYDLEVRLAGTDTVVLEIPGVEFEGGVVYTAFAVGLVSPGMDEPALQAILSVDAESRFRGRCWWGRGRGMPFRSARF